MNSEGCYNCIRSYTKEDGSVYCNLKPTLGEVDEEYRCESYEHYQESKEENLTEEEKEILDFIKVFQSPSNKRLFTGIACCWFARILFDRFIIDNKDTVILYNPDAQYFATRIGDNVYDIRGKISGEGFISLYSYLLMYPSEKYLLEDLITLKRHH